MQEALGVVVAVDVDLGQGIVHRRVGAAFLDLDLKPGQEQLLHHKWNEKL